VEQILVDGHLVSEPIGEDVSQSIIVQLLLGLSIIAVAEPAARAQSGRRPAKSPPAQTQNDDTPVRLRTEEVLLPVSVQSKLGRLPARLDRADIIVTEDDKRQQITSIMRAPANILLILDSSGTVTTLKNINLHRELATKILDSLGEEDKVAVIAYADKVELLSSWTSDRAAIKEALAWNYRPGAGSRLYDSLTYAAEDLLMKISGRRCVVLLTDGVDTISQSPFEPALKAMHQARATLYVVSQAAMLLAELKPKALRPLPIWQRLDRVARKQHQLLQQYVRELEADEKPLQRLVEETGGKIWDFDQPIHCPKPQNRFSGTFAEPRQPDKVVDCETVRNQLIEEIGSEYIISYSSERQPQDTKFHQIKVYSTRTDLQVRVRSGIYAASPGKQ
jgi:VWFA-related protein